MNATQLAKTTNGKAVEELDVLVISAGFAGLYQLDHLPRLGYTARNSGRIGTTASFIPRGRSCAPISATSTGSSV